MDVLKGVHEDVDSKDLMYYWAGTDGEAILNSGIRTLARAAGTVAFLTVLGKILGFAREAGLAAFFGTTAETDAYIVAQTIPYALFSILSYSLSTTFIPVYLQQQERYNKIRAFRFASMALWAVLVLGLILVILGEIFARQLVFIVAPGFSPENLALTAYLSRIIFPMMIFQLLSGITYGMLQANGQFTIPALASLMQSLSIIISTIFFGNKFGIVAVAFGTLIGAFLKFIVPLPSLFALGFRLEWSLSIADPGLKRMLILMGPAMIGAGTGQINILVDRFLASGLSEGSIAALNYANHLFLLAPGILGTSIVTVVYPTFSKIVAKEEWDKFKQSISATLSLINFALIPIVAIVIVLREPLVRIVYQRGSFDMLATRETAWALLFLSFGMAAYSMRELLGRAFYALQDTKTPMLLGFITVALNIVLSLMLIGPLKHGGVALGTSLATLIGFVLLLLAFNRRLPLGLSVRRLITSIWKSGLSAVIMAMTLHLVYNWIHLWFDPTGIILETIVVLMASVLALAVYLGVAAILRINEILIVRREFMRLLKNLRFQRWENKGSESK